MSDKRGRFPTSSLARVLVVGLACTFSGVAAAPMSNKDYATRIQDEVENQNLSCGEMLEMNSFLEELRKCGPPNAATTDLEYAPSVQDPYDGTRVCNRKVSGSRQTYPSRPTYPLSYELFDAFGPISQAAMRMIGVERNMDQPHPVIGALRPQMHMSGANPVISSIQRPLFWAMKLKNCRA